MGLTTLYKMGGFSSLGSYVPGNQKVWNFLKENLDEQSLEGLKQYWRCPPSLSNLYQSLLLFDKPAKHVLPNDANYDKCFRFCSELFRPAQKYKIRRLQDVSRTDLPQTTNAGFPYVQAGLRSKADAWNSALEHAWILFDKASKNRPISFFPDMIFAKGAVCTRDKVKTRFINGVSLSTLIIECCFAIPIEQHQFSGETPAAYVYTPFGGGYSLMREDLLASLRYEDRRANFITMDFKSYDKSGVTQITRDIYDFYMDCFDWEFFDDGSRIPHRQKVAYQNLFRAVCENHINTKLYMPDGYVYQKDLGDNSGSKMFQKIQNFRTALLNILAIYEQFERFPTFVRTLGDDCISGLNLKHHEEPFSIERANNYLNEYDFTVSMDKSISTEVIEEVEFLGRLLYNNQSTRETAEILLRVLYPAREDQSDVDLAMRIVAMYYENSNGNHVLDYFLKRMWFELIPYQIREALRGRKDLWSPHLMKLFRMMGLPSPPSVQLPDPAVMFALVKGKGEKVQKTIDRLLHGPVYKLHRMMQEKPLLFDPDYERPFRYWQARYL